MVFAVNTDEVATPLASVVAVVTLLPVSAKVPLAPVAGAVNVTTKPEFGTPPVVTVATNGLVKAAVTTALCPDPLVTVIVSTGVAELVRVKLAGVDTPETEAATV